MRCCPTWPATSRWTGSFAAMSASARPRWPCGRPLQQCMGGKQVAILVPTTLLAQQHGQTFRDRFADWPVRIEVLSRFCSTREAKEIVAGMRSGRVDVVIGTHRLLQHTKDFRDVGLVIVDEEHRFGVRHKEAIKSLRSEVDVLTLTATPIPRTLNMSLGGLREMSLIATPPAERLSVKTFVSEWSDVVIREACLREIKRGGQGVLHPQPR